MPDKTLFKFGIKVLPLKTGQTTVYQAGDDATYQAGGSANPRMVDNGDGTLSDRATGLMWVKEPQLIIPGATGIHATNQIQVSQGDWATGTAYAKADAVLAIEREDDGVITASRAAYVVTASAPVFAAGDVGRYIYIGATLAGRIMLFTNTTTVTVNATGTIGAGALIIKSSYVCAVAHNSGAGTFTADLAANPTYWRETLWRAYNNNLTTPAPTYWSEAIINSEALDYAGYTDWRLPNFQEMATLLNHEGTNVFAWAFSSTSNFYWTSTTFKGNTAYAFACSVSGVLYYYSKTITTGSYYPRPVRGGL